MSDYDYDEEALDEYEYQQNKGEMVKMMKHQQRLQNELAQEQNAKEQQKVFNEALSQAGIDQDTFNRLIAQNPETTKQVFTENLKNYVSNIASRPRDEQGRFIKQSPAQKAQAKSHQRASVMGLGRRHAETGQPQKRFDPNNRRGTDEEVTDMVRDMFDGDPMFDYDK